MVLSSPWPRCSQNYDRAADGLLADIRTTKPAKGHDRVLYPGLRGAEITAERKANGIPYHPEVIVWFHRVSRPELSEQPHHKNVLLGAADSPCC